jgi:hypothetical protein
VFSVHPPRETTTRIGQLRGRIPSFHVDRRRRLALLVIVGIHLARIPALDVRRLRVRASFQRGRIRAGLVALIKRTPREPSFHYLWRTSHW